MDFDYHLSQKEQDKMERLVPLHQAKIHVAFRANITIGEKRYKRGGCALSEHCIVLAKKTMMGSMTALKEIHILDIEMFSTLSEQECQVTVRGRTINLQSEACMRFAKVLVRNYFVITTLYPGSKRFTFKPHDARLFPKFDPKMSLSQSFQFTYNAYCSQMDVSYEHQIVQWFHTIVTSDNGIADLRELPLTLTETTLGTPADLVPVFSTMVFCPNIRGVVCRDIVRPDILVSLRSLIALSPRLSIIDIHNTGATGGVNELSSAMYNNSKLRVQWWDLSDNPFEDLSPFCAALKSIRVPLVYLNLGGTKLSGGATTTLFRSLLGSRETGFCACRIQYLDITGATIEKETVEAFARFLIPDGHDPPTLKSLKIGCLNGDISKFMSALVRGNQPLEVLDVSGNSLKKQAIDKLGELIKHSETLTSLNIGGTGLNEKHIVSIIKEIAGNGELREMSLDLSNLGLTGKALKPVLDAFSKLKKRNALWVGLSFADNGMGGADITSVVSLIQSLPNIRNVSLGGNLDKGTKDGVRQLMKLLEIQGLEELSLKGSGKKRLGAAIFPFFEHLKLNRSITSLDISDNGIGGEGVRLFGAALKENTTICSVVVDGSKIEKDTALCEFLDVLGSEECNVRNCPFPANDWYEIMQAAAKSKKKKMIANLEKHRTIASVGTLKRRYAVGCQSQLSAMGNPDLDRLLTNIADSVRSALSGLQTRRHAALASAFGLHMPHLAEGEGVDESTCVAGDGDEESPYGVDGAHVTVVEDVTAEADGLQTLQYNSLLIARERPSQLSGLSAPADPDSDDDDDGDGDGDDFVSPIAQQGNSSQSSEGDSD